MLSVECVVAAPLDAIEILRFRLQAKELQKRRGGRLMPSWGHRAIRQVLDNLLGMGWKGRMRKLAVEMVGDGSIARGV